MLAWQVTRNVSKFYTSKPQIKDALQAAARDGLTQWKMLSNGIPLGEATTQVLASNGAFVLDQKVNITGDLEIYVGKFVSGLLKGLSIDLSQMTITVNTITEVNYTGSMRSITLGTTIRKKTQTVAANGSLPPTVTSGEEETVKANHFLRLQIKGRTDDKNQIVLQGFADITGVEKIQIDDYKIRHNASDMFLSSLSPTDCMPGLKLGMRWKVATLDPQSILTNAFAKKKLTEFSSGSFDTEKLMEGTTAESEVYVAEELQPLEWNGASVPCYLVVADNRSMKNRIWVHAENSRVLKQTSEWSGRLIEIVRIPAKEE